MTSTQINRYNADGSENLDYWFGVRETKSSNFSVSYHHKPQYVRYTMTALKKRSTKRLEKMHMNLFGTIDNRYVMIANLYSKLNAAWSDYNEKLLNAFSGKETGKRGRKQKFSERQIWQMIADYEFNNMKLVEIARKYDTNIATVSQTINGKGTYAFLFEDEYEFEQEIIKAWQ